ncbi:hypothetical protein BaRGS_00040481 [Batillaria attramentaria]|uniref:Uncharacterized protein n=1 Tax=Batillaria attramentaria TaxID=370345 RepID=A0ABD0IZX8_9CAEN
MVRVVWHPCFLSFWREQGGLNSFWKCPSVLVRYRHDSRWTHCHSCFQASCSSCRPVKSLGLLLSCAGRRGGLPSQRYLPQAFCVPYRTVCCSSDFGLLRVHQPPPSVIHNV